MLEVILDWLLAVLKLGTISSQVPPVKAQAVHEEIGKVGGDPVV
jgi:hypothetical protein